MPQILQTALQVDDIASAVAWYRKQFVCDVKYQDENSAILSIDNLSIALVAASRDSARHGTAN